MVEVLEKECGFTCPSAVVRKDCLILQNTRQQVFLIQVHPHQQTCIAAYSQTSLMGFLFSIFHLFVIHLFVLMLSCILLMRHGHTLSFLSMSKLTSLPATNKNLTSFAQ
jgi:hypothetical protein